MGSASFANQTPAPVGTRQLAAKKCRERTIPGVWRTMTRRSDEMFWAIAAHLMAEDPRIVEGTIMNGRCLRVGREFLALVDFQGSGMVVKLPRDRVDALIAAGVGRPFAPAGRVFREWVALPHPDRRRWEALLREGISFVAAPKPSNSRALSAAVRKRAARSS
jgi:hypothetical protein